MMNLVGGYGSGDESSSDEADADRTGATASVTAPVKATSAATSASSHAGEDCSGKKRKVVLNYTKLPISKPLDLENAAKTDEDAPLKRAAQLEAARGVIGKSLLASIPPPRATLGGSSDVAGGSGGIRIDLSALTKPRREQRDPVAGILRRDDAPDLVAENVELPQGALNHAMFGGGDAPKVRGDGPSADDIYQMRKTPAFTKINADDVQDKDWFMKNQVSGGPGLHKGKNVAIEISQYDASAWQKTTHANPSKVQKRKHQINWLAQEAIEQEAEMLDRGATSKLTKGQTAMKYGW